MRTLILGAICIALIYSQAALAEEKSDSAPESCIKLVAALEACDEGPSGPFGSLREACKTKAESEFACDLPIHEVRKLMK